MEDSQVHQNQDGGAQAMMPPPSVPARTPSGDVVGEGSSPAPSAAASTSGRQARPRRSVRPSARALQARENSPDAWEHGGRSQRATRTPTGNRPQIKLKMRQAGGAAGGLGQGPKTKPYMQGFDRELDSEDDETGEGLAFEEQLILRMPEGPNCDKLREAVAKRQIGDDVWFKFKDSRRAVFHVGDALYSAKLVDLPSIVESHKTLDNRQFFKISDISQMLLIEDQIQDETQASGSGSGRGFDINDFIYPHGITPPMKWARKRRFRKRAPRRAIETVEKEVERLLKEDKKADEVQYEILESADGLPPDLDDDDAEGEDDDDGRSVSASVAGATSVADTPRPTGSDDEGTQMGDGDASQMGDSDREDGRGGDGYGYDDDDDVDEDLAAELDAALEEEDDAESMRGAGSEAQSRASDQEDLWDDDDDDDGDDDDEEEADEDENDDEKEARVREAQLEAECKEIEALVRRKQADVDSTMNLIIKSRHQQALRRLTTERDIKRGQLADVKQSRREKKEAKAAAEAAAEAEAEASRIEDQAKQDAHAADAAKSSAAPEDATGRVGLTGSPERQAKAAAAVSDKPATPLDGSSGSAGGRSAMPPPAVPSNRGGPSALPTPMDVDTPARSQPPSSTAAAGGPAGDVAGNADEDGVDDDDDDLWDDDGEDE